MPVRTAAADCLYQLAGSKTALRCLSVDLLCRLSAEPGQAPVIDCSDPRSRKGTFQVCGNRLRVCVHVHLQLFFTGCKKLRL